MASPIQNISDRIVIPPACQERYLPMDIPCARPLRERGILAAGISRLFAPYEILRIHPAFHLLIFPTAGTAQFETPQTKGHFQRGQAWFAPARHPHHYLTKKFWAGFWFALQEKGRWERLAEAPVRQWHSTGFSRLQSAMENFWDEAARSDPLSQEAARAYAEIIGVFLDRELRPDPPGVRDLQHRLSSVWDEVNRQLQYPWRVHDLASKAHLSPVYFHRIMVKHHGMRPMEMVTLLRMRQAKELLRNTHYTLDQIASLIGYQTAFAFSRAFKRHTGCSPKTFRSGA
ncbi:MAG: helix-turn-helix transcriptional regulator [Verrucomicrobiae bacterium]|nr:helix-turn-helix transcriptional regulator [Verrucomicrobiae bacterium]